MGTRKLAKKQQTAPLVGGQKKGMGVIKPNPVIEPNPVIDTAYPPYSVIFAPREPCDRCLSPDVNKCVCPPPQKPIEEDGKAAAVFAKMKSHESVRCTFCAEWFDPDNAEAGYVGRWSRSCRKCWGRLRGVAAYEPDHDLY